MRLWGQCATSALPPGVPIAKHCDSSTPAGKCVAGWILRGRPGSATFVHLDNDHPLWFVASRNDIPQPGAYSHFHWLGMPHHASELIPGTLMGGYFLELTAIKTFAFEHGGEDIVVTPGTDLATHLNVTSTFPGY